MRAATHGASCFEPSRCRDRPAAHNFFDDVNPVDAGLSLGEVLRLEVPDRVGAVGEEQRALATIATLGRLAGEPLEQCGVTLEGGAQPLVDRPFAGAIGHRLERVDHADERDLGVLALVAFGTARALPQSTPTAATTPLGARLLHVWALTKLQLGRVHVRRATSIDLNEHDVTIVGRSRRILEKLARLAPDGVDHAEHGALRRRPLTELRERRTCVGERHLCAQPRHGHYRRQAEPAAEPERTIDRAIACRAPPANATPNRTLEDHLAESCADLVAHRAAEHKLAPVVDVLC